ncbi:uncharacterized protein LOC127079511 [Lathyrus oleraceus]|uniref:uncharacterized protein LOC127079511 n=1 Tax=Pisum sativum TaxID=3888 RepID=UPI0021CED3C7|nr:uncharacterized protein LOC127079511 [Pisum sativum]
MTYTELYPSLLQKGLVTPRPLGPPPNPLPPWYNQDAHCSFHEGTHGHNLEGCYALKHIVQELVEKKILSFLDVGPNVKSNPLPAHSVINSIEDVSDVCIIKNVEDVKTPFLALHARLAGVSLINTCHDNYEECVIYPKGCKLVRADIQNLMDQGVLQVFGPTTNKEISVIEPFFNLPEPVEITYQRKNVVHPSPVVVCMPTPFPFESTKVVPYKYYITLVDGVVDEKPKNVEESIKEATTAVPVPESGGVQSAMQSGEAIEFLKMIKKSDYKIVDQLHQTPSKIFIISLLLNSQAHREALLKVLSQDHATQDITVGQFDRVVTNITACNTLGFTNEELPKEGQNHNRALHVSIKCQEDALARVLVDTGSSLDVLPKRALAKLPYQGPEMKPNALVIPFGTSMDTCYWGNDFYFASENEVCRQQQARHCLRKEDFIISQLSSFRYIEVDEDALETSFQALETVNATLTEVKNPVEKVILSLASLKSVKSIVESGGPIGWGQVIDVSKRKDHFGLGHKSSSNEEALVHTKDRIRSI